MKNLVNVLDRIDAGSEEAVREHIGEALGLWSCAHGIATQVVAVSENSVAFVDDQSNLWVGHHTIAEGSVILTDVKKLMNVTEEAQDMGFLAEISDQFVKAVAENQEDAARDLVGLVLEYKQKVVRKGKVMRINDPVTRAKNFRKKSYAARWNIEQAAKKTAKKTAHKATKATRMARSNKRRKLLGLGPNKAGAAGHKATNESERKELALLEALEQLIPVTAELMAVTETLNRLPVIEGVVTEMGSHGCGQVATKGGKKGKKDSKGRKWTPPWQKKDEEAETNESVDANELVKAIEEGRTHSTGIKVNVAGLEEVPDGEYEIQKGNSRSCCLLQRGAGKKGEHAFHKLPTKLVRKGVKNHSKSVKESEEDADKLVTEAIAKSHEGAGKAVVVVNLNALTESFDMRDFMFSCAAAWDGFRGEPVTEELAKTIKEGASAEDIVTAQPMFLLCTEQEVYDAIHKCFETLDPNEITAKAKEIVAVQETEDGKAQIEEFLTQFQDNELVESIRACDLPLSEQLDSLLLEGPNFEFGAADDLGSDDLDDDRDTEGMEDEDDDLDDDDDLDNMDDDIEDEDDMGDEMVSLEISASELREKLTGILDVIGDEIEDSDEFEELRDAIEDEESELDSDILTRTLEVIDDYFSAVGKGAERDAESRQEDEMGDETLDDMDDLDDEGNDDTEGGATDFGGGEGDEEIELGA